MDLGGAGVAGIETHEWSSLSLLRAGLIVISSLGSLIYLLQWSTAKRLKLPPGPPTWPIIGSLPYLGKSVHNSLKTLSDKYGGVMYMKFGIHPAVVISSADAAEELFKHHDATFANRPTVGVFDDTNRHSRSNRESFTMSPYNAQFQKLKKICMTEIFSFSKLSQSQHIRKEAIKDVIEAICANSAAGKLSELRLLFRNQQLAVFCKLLFGKQVTSVTRREDGVLVSDLKHLDSLVETMVTLFGKLEVADFLCPKWLLPAVKWLDLQGRGREWKKAVFDMIQTLAKILEEHKQIQKVCKATDVGFQKDFLHSILLEGEGRINDKQIMAVCFDLTTSSIDSTASVLHWCFIFLLRNPGCLSKLQAEIDSVVGQDRFMEEKDIFNLPYLQAVVKETFRISSPTPFLLPRSSRGPERIAGYDIPPNCILLVNTYAILKDASVWRNPEEFKPERFLGKEEEFNFNGTNSKFMPFGTGRRGCIGANLAILNVSCTLGSICHALDISLPPHMSPQDVSIDQLTYFVCNPLHNLRVLSKPRPAYAKYVSNWLPTHN